MLLFELSDFVIILINKEVDQSVKGVIDHMKENIATIPLIKAFNTKDECPFCNLEREAEQHAVSFILGSAYMEDDLL